MIGRIGSACAWLAVAMAGLIGPAAGAQQITEATCWADVRRGLPSGSSASFSIPQTLGSEAQPVDVTAGCADTAVRFRIDQVGQIITLQVQQQSDAYAVYYNAGLRLKAGPDGATVLNVGPMLFGWGFSDVWEPGETLTLSPNETRSIGYFELGYYGLQGDRSLQSTMQVTNGAVVGLGVSGSGQIVGPVSVWCAGSRPWSISSDSIAEFDCDSPLPVCPSYWSAQFTMAATGSSLFASANTPPSPVRVEFGCNFYLNTPALVRYGQVGGAYCDGYPRLDGNLFPTPNSGVACLGLEGYLNLSEGWHSIEAEEWDSGNGSFSLQIVGGPGIDCNCNGRPDVGEILWWHEYGYSETGSDPDADNDGYLDSCGMLGDLNASGTVDGADMAILLDAWGRKGTSADIDCSGSVDGVDLALLLDNWSRKL
ncbi:MAG: hypothetical protein ACKO0W_00225 [Planctomycetota bacterium]